MYSIFSHGSEGSNSNRVFLFLLMYSIFSHGSEGKLDTNDLSSLLYIRVISHGSEGNINQSLHLLFVVVQHNKFER